MIPLNIRVDGSPNVTVLSNAFIDDYMKNANDAQIKIYLYLLRMISANLPTDLPEIADKFNLTESDVVRSLEYWEKFHLMNLDYDDQKNITGIRFLDFQTGKNSLNANKKDNCEEKNSDKKNSDKNYSVKNNFEKNNSNQDVIRQNVPDENIQDKLNYILAGESDQAPDNHSPKITRMTMDYEKEKASYSVKDIQKISNDPNVKMLLMVAEQYFERPLNTDEIKSLLFLYDRLAFSFDLLDHLLLYCVELNQKSMNYIEQVAYGWYETGVTSVKEAKAQVKKDQRSSYAIMSYLGKTGIPTEIELSYIRRWTISYAFSLAIIEEACDRCVLATDHHRFEYTESILKSWHNNNVQSKEDISRLDQQYEATKAARAQAKADAQAKTAAFQPSNSPSGKNYGNFGSSNGSTSIGKSHGNGSSFCDIEQQDYDLASLDEMVTRKMLKKNVN